MRTAGSEKRGRAIRARFSREPVWHAEDGFVFLSVVRQAEGGLLGLMGFQRYEPGEDTRHMRFEDPADVEERSAGCRL
jgi:hypothetical protein